MTGSDKPTTRPDKKRNAQASASDRERAKTLLSVGVNALKGASKGVLARQVRIFDALFLPGTQTHHQERAESSSQNFETVLDERVARSLARLGYPPPEVLNALVSALLGMADEPSQSSSASASKSQERASQATPAKERAKSSAPSRRTSAKAATASPKKRKPRGDGGTKVSADSSR
ncbi:hypothetical protein [Ottowia sp.]|uniref:hypothetical protein n=1 Tax=Ottowia sp. TaxID=1898956 RepID=UPI003A84FE83